MRVTEDISGSTMRLDPIFPDWLGIASLCAVAAILAGSGAYRILGTWSALAVTAACLLLAVGTVVLGGVGTPVFVRITPHGVAVWRSWWDTESATIRPLTPWEKLDEVVAIDDWLDEVGVWRACRQRPPSG